MTMSTLGRRTVTMRIFADVTDMAIEAWAAPTATRRAPVNEPGPSTLATGTVVDESSTVRLEITRRAELAIRALALLGGSSGRMKAADLATELDTTVRFVPQVLLPLVRAGWVESDPGPTGGYRCRPGTDDVSALDVIEAVDGATDAGRCVVADRPCRASEPCVLHDAWARARSELVRVLDSTPVVPQRTEVGR